MNRLLGLSIFAVFFLCNCTSNNTSGSNSIEKIELHLSAFGVESDNFPSIDGEIDFIKKTSTFRKWYYDPAHKDSTYSLSLEELNEVLLLLQESDLNKLKKEYTIEHTPDLPRSTVEIITKYHNYNIDDYGMRGDEPLPELYKIVYKF